MDLARLGTMGVGGWVEGIEEIGAWGWDLDLLWYDRANEWMLLLRSLGSPGSLGGAACNCHYSMSIFHGFSLEVPSFVASVNYIFSMLLWTSIRDAIFYY